MWELSISIDSKKAACIDNLMQDITPYVKKAGGVMARGKALSRDYLALACEETKSKIITDALHEIISNIIITDFKLEYLQENSRLPINNQINYNAFIKALVEFDREFDREVVIRKLFFNKELMLDGFYNFRLKELRDRWQEICDLANNNSAYLSYHETFLELLKFLVNTINSKLDEVHIFDENGKYVFYDKHMNKIKNQKYHLDEEINSETLIPSLINLSPNKIVFHHIDKMPVVIVNMISSIFENRIEVR
ncbi:MAG: hypothetical protein GX756_04315 [Clostridiales bacterium]|nr:hypothetical protein [Clostridiales bacterium]